MASVRANSGPGAFSGWFEPERLVLLHAGILAVGCAWWFGGQSHGARTALLAWGTLGIILFLAVLARRRHEIDRQILWHLAPLFVFDALVLTSCLNPSTQLINHGGDLLLAHTTPRWAWLPSSARPDLSLRELWQFNGIILSCYNVVLAVRRRRQIRLLIAVLCANALVLAVFGTFQKLAGADGIGFGLVEVPQPYFFATFVYHNHWGAFLLLHLLACVALLQHKLAQGDYRDLRHSPLPAAAVTILYLAATAPLSGSRSTTVLASASLAVIFVQALARIVRRQNERRRSIFWPVAAMMLTAAAASGSIAYLSRDVIATRLRITNEQLTELRQEDRPSTRARLYGDTWRMAVEKPVFGWGLESYEDVFRIFNTQRQKGHWRNQPQYREAHSDWLQAIAEVGFAGTGCLLALGLVPLCGAGMRLRHSSLTRHLLAGCGVVLLYATVEFPFANPAVMITFWLLLYSAARYARLDIREPVGKTVATDHA